MECGKSLSSAAATAAVSLVQESHHLIQSDLAALASSGFDPRFDREPLGQFQ
jgi:hypothetical protein